MAGNLIQYSGLVTKARAMAGNLLTKEELYQLTEISTVDEAISFLKSTKSYCSIYQGREGQWHRGQAESISKDALFEDIEKLYRFANVKQRQAFEFLFFRYEVDLVKKYLEILLLGKGNTQNNHIEKFVYRHANFSVDDLKKASGIQEFQQVLSKTPYYKIFARMYHVSEASYVDYAMNLDVFYYTFVYDAIKKMKKSQTRKILMEIYGTQIDWLNMLWIYRSKRFYHQTTEEVEKMIIPISYKIKPSELKELIHAVDLAEVHHVLSRLHYLKGKDSHQEMEDENFYHYSMQHMYQQIAGKYAMSIAPVLKYLHDREQEAARITKILEGIRYELPPKEIRDLIFITE